MTKKKNKKQEYKDWKVDYGARKGASTKEQLVHYEKMIHSPHQVHTEDTKNKASKKIAKINKKLYAPGTKKVKKIAQSFAKKAMIQEQSKQNK